MSNVLDLLEVGIGDYASNVNDVGQSADVPKSLEVAIKAVADMIVENKELKFNQEFIRRHLSVEEAGKLALACMAELKEEIEKVAQ